MKILVKHVDNLKSSWNPNKETIPEYLVYKMTNDDIPVSCKICLGDIQKDKEIQLISNNHELSENKSRGLRNLLGLTLPVEEVSYDEFRNNDSKTIFDNE